MKPLFYFAFLGSYLIISSAPKWRNGRRKRLKIVRVIPWGFESPLGHQFNILLQYKILRLFYCVSVATSDFIEDNLSRNEEKI